MSEDLDLDNKDVIHILERMTDGFYALDNKWKIVYWNHHAETMLGKLRTEVMGKCFWECFPAETHPAFYQQYHRVFKEKVPVSFTAYYPGVDIWSELNVYPSSNGLFVYFNNITERVKVEEKMKMLFLIAKGTVNSVSFVDPEGNIQWVNAAFTKITGIPFDEAIGRKHSELLFGAETDEEVIFRIKDNMKRGQRFHEELLIYTRDKKKIWLEVNGECVFKDDGIIHQYFIIQTDITERKRTEEELKRLSMIVTLAPNGVALINLDKRIAWINESFTGITGYTPQEAIGKMPRELIRGAETDMRIVKHLNDQLDKGEGFHCENIYYHKSGEKIILDLWCQPLYDKSGKANQFFLIIKDLSDTKKLQDQLIKEKKRRLREVTNAAIKAQEQERSIVGKELHDNVNQVLTTVKLYAELCRDGIGNTSEMLNRSVSLLNESINEIRNLSNRLSAPSIGKMRLKDSIKDLVESVSATNKVSVSLRASKSMVDFYANEELHLAVYRILQEHLTNILKHAEASSVMVSLNKTLKSLTLKVTDNGKGFDLHAKRKGIGITNMTSRAESIKGKLSIQTKPGTGCTLTAIFPTSSKDQMRSVKSVETSDG